MTELLRSPGIECNAMFRPWCVKFCGRDFVSIEEEAKYLILPNVLLQAGSRQQVFKQYGDHFGRVFYVLDLAASSGATCFSEVSKITSLLALQFGFFADPNSGILQQISDPACVLCQTFTL